MSRLLESKPTCVAVRVSDTANISGHGSTLCSPTVEKILCRSPVSKRSHVGNLRQTLPRGKWVVHKRVETSGVYPLVPAAGRGDVPALRRAQLPAEIQRKTSRPSGANTPAAVRVPRSAGAEKGAAPLGRTRLRQFEYPAQPVLKKAAAQKGRTRLRQFGHPSQPVLKTTAAQTRAKSRRLLTVYPLYFPVRLVTIGL